jgi:hypothetical protein
MCGRTSAHPVWCKWQGYFLVGGRAAPIAGPAEATNIHARIWPAVDTRLGRIVCTGRGAATAVGAARGLGSREDGGKQNDDEAHFPQM